MMTEYTIVRYAGDDRWHARSRSGDVPFGGFACGIPIFAMNRPPAAVDVYVRRVPAVVLEEVWCDICRASIR